MMLFIFILFGPYTLLNLTELRCTPLLVDLNLDVYAPSLLLFFSLIREESNAQKGAWGVQIMILFIQTRSALDQKYSLKVFRTLYFHEPLFPLF